MQHEADQQLCHFSFRPGGIGISPSTPTYRRFAVTLTSANARLGADADRYSFTVVDFHLLLFAGFDRRTESLELWMFG